MRNKLILGTVQFGKDYGINNKDGKPDFKQIHSILDFAHSQGIRTLDTAEAYDNSQEIIGKYHRCSTLKFEVLTKFSPKRTDLPANIYERITKNIETLGIDSLYAYMFHTYEDYNSYFSTYQEELLLLKRECKLKKIGVSLHSNDHILKVISNPNIDLIQLPFNLLDNSTQRKEVLLKAKNNGIEIHTRSAFLQGLFFMDSNALPGNLLKLEKELKKVHAINQNNKIHDLALNYVLSKNYIDFVIIGVDNKDQLRKNLETIGDVRTHNLHKFIDEIEVENNYLLNPSNWIL